MGNVCDAVDEQFDYDGFLMADKKAQSVEIKSADDGKDGLGPIRRSVKFPDKLVETPYDGATPRDQCSTIYWAFKRGVQDNGDGNCMGFRKRDFEKKTSSPYEWTSYKAVDSEVTLISKGLAALGSKRGDSVGICAANRPEWTMTSLAIYGNSLVTVALYDTLGAEAIEYILHHAEVKFVFCSKAKLNQILAVLPKCPDVKYIVQYDDKSKYGQTNDVVDPEHVRKCEEAKVELVPYSKLLELGAGYGQEPVPAEPKDLAFIMYTSGTTGVPKGAMLSHANIMACCAGVVRGTAKLYTSDVYYSYLPLAHIFETVVQVALLMSGSSIGFYQGDIKLLADDLSNLRPTVFCGVPRVFTRIFGQVQAKIEAGGSLKKYFALKMIRTQCQHVRRGEPISPFINNKIGATVRGGLGMDRCRVMITGSAPMPPYLMEFLRAIIAPRDGIHQGYGMTETSAAVSASECHDPTMGHVGPPLPSAEIRLRSVPDMSYLITDPQPRGEVLARGPSIFLGYYKNQQATNETLQDGWISTGDIGRWNPNGTLSIIDRKKNLFKLAQGEYIAAEKIEGAFATSKYVMQSFVYGNSYKSFLISVVVPAFDPAMQYAKEKGWWNSELGLPITPEFLAHFKKVFTEHYDEFKTFIMSELDAAAKRQQLHSFEKPKDTVVEVELDGMGQGFTLENECLTPTFKLRRQFLLKRYEEKIRALYTKHGEAPKADERW